MDIDKAFKEFMEFPKGSNEKTVTTVSCKLFAKWYLEKLIDEIVKKTLDEDALTIAYMYGVRDGSKRIKELEDRLIESRTRIDDLERWVAGIADDHRQIPDWIQQSARSLLAQEGELSMTVPKGYAIVPIEPTKSMIDAGFRADSDAFPLKYIYQAMIEAAQEGE